MDRGQGATPTALIASHWWLCSCVPPLCINPFHMPLPLRRRPGARHRQSPQPFVGSTRRRALTPSLCALFLSGRCETIWTLGDFAGSATAKTLHPSKASGAAISILVSHLVAMSAELYLALFGPRFSQGPIGLMDCRHGFIFFFSGSGNQCDTLFCHALIFFVGVALLVGSLCQS